MRALAIAMLVVSCSSETAKGVARAKIVDGTEDPGDPSVVAILLRRTRCVSPAIVPGCSGVLISDRVVVTAAHCVEPAESGIGYEVAFGARADDPAIAFGVVVGVSRHPKYDPATHAYDVAVLRLAEPAKSDPVALTTAMPVPIPALGDRVRAVGFGTPSADGTPGIKRTGTMKVSEVSELGFRSGPDPSMTCAADSGGPLFLSDETGAESLVGFTASGDPACREYAFNVRLDTVRDFVDAFVAETAKISPGPPKGTIGPEAFCSAPCAADVDCPAGLFCTSSGSERRCSLPGQAPGSFSVACSGESGCAPGSTCARFWPDGDFACLCFTPCEGGPIPPTGDAGADAATPVAPAPEDSGCSCDVRGSGRAPSAALSILLLLVARRRRPT